MMTVEKLYEADSLHGQYGNSESINQSLFSTLISKAIVNGVLFQDINTYPLEHSLIKKQD